MLILLLPLSAGLSRLTNNSNCFIFHIVHIVFLACSIQRSGGFIASEVTDAVQYISVG